MTHLTQKHFNKINKQKNKFLVAVRRLEIVLTTFLTEIKKVYLYQNIR